MLKIELHDYGIEQVLKNISEYLEEARKSKSNKQKNEMIYKALGAVDTLFYVISVVNISNDTEECTDV